MMNIFSRITVKIFFRGLLLIIAACLAILVIKIIFSSYEELLATLKPSLLWDNYESRIPYVKDLFNNSRFEALQILTPIIFIVSISILVYCWIKTEKINSSTQKFSKRFRQSVSHLLLAYRNLSSFQKTFLFLVLVALAAHRLFYLWQTVYLDHKFISGQSFYDESVSYKYFVQQGWLTSMTYYPDTNNHIFYNLICGFFNLFFDSQEMVMRTPAFLLNLILLATIFLSLNRIFNFNVAIIALCLCGFLYSASIYALIGRGYMLMALFAFVSSLAVYKYCIDKDKFYLYIFVIASILGFYSVPVFLYHFVSMGFILMMNAAMTKSIKFFYSILAASFTVVAAVLICYLPVILVSGPGALLGQNRWVQPLDFSSLISLLPAYLAELSEYLMSITGVARRGYFIVFAFAQLILFFSIRHSEKVYRQWLWLVIIAGTIPILLVVIMRVMAPYRALSYYTFIMLSGLALVMVSIISKIKNEKAQKWMLAFLSFVIIVGGFFSYQLVC